VFSISEERAKNYFGEKALNVKCSKNALSNNTHGHPS
jgi:hypothetical protein